MPHDRAARLRSSGDGAWWRTAEGRVVLLAANLTDRPQTATYAVFDTDATAELSLKPHEVKRIER